MGNRLAALAVYARIPKDASASAHEEAQGRIASPLTSLDLAVLRWRSLRRRDRHADALQVLQAARAQSADDVAQYPADELPRLYYRIGETLLDLSDPAAARQEFERVLAAVPDRRLFSWAQYQLGRCHRQLGRDDEAEAAFRSASVHADEDLQRRIDAVRNAGESSHGSPG
jgi:tetratricopeptide (TPR) repeat protein